MSGELRAGIARSTITPPLGSYLIGYGNRFRGANAVRDELHATALVLDDGKSRLGIVALDLLLLCEAAVARIRRQVAAHTALAPDALLLACSHTHAGPVAFADEHSPARHRRAHAGLVPRIVDAVARAAASARPVRLRHGRGIAWGAVNRRERRPDGRLVIGTNPDGRVDRDLQVLALELESGALLATLVSHACHPAILSPRNRAVSAEWPGAMRRLVEAETGAPCLFLQGACGDLNPVHGWGPREAENVEAHGRRVAAAALTLLRAGLDPVTETPLGFRREVLWLPVVPRRDGRGRAVSYRRRLWQVLRVPPFLADRLLDQLYPWQPVVRRRPDGGEERGMEIQALRLGGCALVAHAAETLNEIGAAIKARSPFARTLFAGYSNGCVGYLPTAAAAAEGGYEVEDAPVAYRMSGTFDPTSEARAVEASIRLLATLHGSPGAPPAPGA